MPRGLHQLGNTCYLNSLLQVRGLHPRYNQRLTYFQYFYTIRDLRETVASLSAVAKKSTDLLDDELDAHRVGGRLVTRREIVRSRRCAFDCFTLHKIIDLSNASRCSACRLVLEPRIL